MCDNGASNVGNYITIDPFLLEVIGNFTITGNQNGWGVEDLYVEASNKLRMRDTSALAEYFDRTFPAIYGMDIDQDNNLEILPVYLCGTSPFDLCVSSIDIIDQTLDFTSFLDTNLFTDSTDMDFYSSGGFAQTANIGSFTTNGEIFVAYASEFTVGTGKKIFAKVYNSVGSEIKSIIDSVDNTFPVLEKRISNFAVADVDVDLKNDYCIAFNDTARDNNTKIHCYSGLTNNIMTNCTLSGWATNNPIHLSLLNWDTTTITVEAVTTWGIFNLETNDGTECNNLRSNGFIGLTSASEGALVPVSVGGDTISGTKDGAVDLIYYGADGARFFKSQTITGEGSQSGALCGADHIIFCDDFNYQFGLFQRGWQVLERDGELNTSITPINNRLNSTVKKFQSFVHESDSVDVNYTVPTAFPSINDERILTVMDSTIVFSFIHPVVSHSFDLRIIDSNGDIEFRIDDRDLQPSIQLIFNNQNISYVNESSPTLETVLCIDCFSGNVTHNVKVTQFFGKDNEKEQGFSYPFNLSFEKGFYRVFVDNELIGDNIFFTDNGSTDFSTWLFTKDKETLTGFTLDNIFSYRGTSRIIDNSAQFFTSLQTVFGCQEGGDFCSSTSDCCSLLTCVNNACTASSDPLVDNVNDNAVRDIITPLAEASNISLGTWYLIIMVAVGIVVFFGITISTHAVMLSFVAFLIIEFLMLIIGTRLGLLPVGIIISIAVIGLVIIGVVVTKWVTGVSPNG